jgi:hypothetical protein
VDPLAIDPASYLFARPNHRSAPSADLPWRVRLVVTERDSVCRVKSPAHGFAFRDTRCFIQGAALNGYRDAEILLPAALDRLTTEVGRGSHAVLPSGHGYCLLAPVSHPRPPA